MPKYPFEPRSNAHLLPGQFWGVPLSDGRLACGRVLAVKAGSDSYFPGNSRTFLAALMHWEGDEPPTAEDIARVRERFLLTRLMEDWLDLISSFEARFRLRGPAEL